MLFRTSLVFLSALSTAYAAPSSRPVERSAALSQTLDDMKSYTADLRAIDGPAGSFDGSWDEFNLIAQQMQHVGDEVNVGTTEHLSNQSFGNLETLPIVVAAGELSAASCFLTEGKMAGMGPALKNGGMFDNMVDDMKNLGSSLSIYYSNLGAAVPDNLRSQVTYFGGLAAKCFDHIVIVWSHETFPN